VDESDVAGRRCRVLVERETWTPGRHTIQWNGTDDAGRTVGFGLDFIRATAPGSIAIARIAHVR